MRGDSGGDGDSGDSCSEGDVNGSGDGNVHCDCCDESYGVGECGGGGSDDDGCRNGGGEGDGRRQRVSSVSLLRQSQRRNKSSAQKHFVRK